MIAIKRLAARSGKAPAVEFWRFVFTVLVAVYHLEIYYVRRNMFLSGVSAVEYFFVLAGFLMAKSASSALEEREERMTVREAHMAALGFVKRKLLAIYPVLIAVTLIWVFIVLTSMNFQIPGQDKTQLLMNTEWELLLMVGTPFGFDGGMTWNIPMWFLTALIVVGYIYTYVIYRHYDFVAFAAPAVGVLLYIYFALNAPTILEHGSKMGMLNAGMVKAAAGMSLGIALYHLYAYLSKRRWCVVWRIVLSLLELYAVYRFFALTLYQTGSLDNYRRLVYILIIVLISFLNVTALSKLLSNPVSRLLGGLSLPMYLCHYCLIPVFFKLTGMTVGFGGASVMTVRDMLLFSLLVICVSVLITLVVAGVKRGLSLIVRKTDRHIA